MAAKATFTTIHTDPAPQLRYNIAEELLFGTIDKTLIRCNAGSGGYAGTKKQGKENYFLKNNALATGVGGPGAHAFGPIPLGYWWMHPHESDANRVRLAAFPTTQTFNRGPFLIHGRGPIGSEGCIVPYNFSDVQKVHTAVVAFIEKYKKKPILEVFATGGNLDSKFFTA